MRQGGTAIRWKTNLGSNRQASPASGATSQHLIIAEYVKTASIQKLKEYGKLQTVSAACAVRTLMMLERLKASVADA